MTHAVAKKNNNSDYGQDNDDEGDSCHDNIGGVLLVNNNAMMMMMMMIRPVIKISSCQANDTSRQEIQQLGILFGSIFLLFSYKSRRGHFHNSG